MRSLPLSLAALHLLFRDGERFADGNTEAFGFGVAGDMGDGWQWLHLDLMSCLCNNILSGAPMQFKISIFAILLAASVPLGSQTNATTISCDPASCRHRYLNGDDFIVLESKEARIAVALERVSLNPKFLSVTIAITNIGDDPIDVVPSKSWVGVDTPKKDILPYVDPEKVAAANHGSDYATVMKLAMQANTIDKGQNLVGSIFFKADKKAQLVHLIIPVGLHMFYVPLTLRTSR
jgi:hypothetical protein